MGIQLYIFLLVLFVHSLNLDQYYSDPKEALQATQGICPILVALHSQRTLQTRSASIAHYCQDSELTSLQGPCLYCPHSAQDDGANQDTLALQVLLTPKQDECSSLRTMRHTMASMHRRVLCAWSQEDRDNADTWNYAGWPPEESRWGSTQQKPKSPRRTRRTPTPRRSQGKGKGKNASMVPAYDPPWNAKAPAATTTAASSGSDPQTAQQLQSLVNKLQNNDQPLISTGDSADHRRDHRYKDYFQEHASSSQEGGPCTCKVQSGKSSTPQAPQFLDCLCGREYQEVEYVRRRLHPERHCNGGGAQQSPRGPSRSKAPSRCHKGATLQARCRGARGDRDYFGWRSRGRDHEDRYSSDDPEENTLSGGSLEQIQLPNADDTADPKGEGTSKRQRLDASALGSRALSPFPEPGK